MLKVQVARLFFKAICYGVFGAILGSIVGILTGLCVLWALKQLPKSSYDERRVDCMSKELDKLAQALPSAVTATSDPRLTYELNEQHQKMLLDEAHKICNPMQR